MDNDITVKLGNFLSWENAEEAIKEIERLRELAKEEDKNIALQARAIRRRDDEIERLRKEAADWKQTAQMLAMDLGKIEYAAVVYDDVQSGLYEKVRERIKSIE